MAKKKNKDEWSALVKKTLNRKRSNREHKVPTDYLLSLADSIHRINPSKEIAYNTIKDVYVGGYEDGYVRAQADARFFKAKQKQHIEAEFKQFQDSLDDQIHLRNIKQ